jgi:hypothetical protein
MSTSSTWDSVERLSYWLSIIRWLPAVAGVITVIAAVAVALVSNRLDTLRAERAANRHLLPTQQQEIARQLKQFAGTPYTIRAYPDDQDALNLFLQIVVALTRQIGSKYQPNTLWLFSLVVGVSIEIAPSHVTDLAPAAKALASVLNENGIESVEGTNPGVETEASMITIRVGHKPR